MQMIYNYSPLKLEAYFNDHELNLELIKKINKNFYRLGQFDINEWDNISKNNIETLKKHFMFELPRIVWSGVSKDGTKKYLVSFKDGLSVETVFIPSEDRNTLCISSQVGCAIGCKFCHTGTMGLSRNLKTHEIVGQLLAVIKDLGTQNRVSNIVFMGQGEPLHNFRNVKDACEIFLHQDGLALSKQKVTISTSGLVPQIERWEEFPDVNIAVSLHAVRDDKRSELMPINKVHDLKRLFSALDKVPQKSSRRIMYEYILIKDFNDGLEDIEGLKKVIKKKKSKINIIPFNDYPDSKFKRPSDEKINWFRQKLHDEGYVTTIRVTRGDDILAACGQLKSEFDKLNLPSSTK